MQKKKIQLIDFNLTSFVLVTDLLQSVSEQGRASWEQGRGWSVFLLVFTSVEKGRIAKRVEYFWSRQMQYVGSPDDIVSEML